MIPRKRRLIVTLIVFLIICLLASASPAALAETAAASSLDRLSETEVLLDAINQLYPGQFSADTLTDEALRGFVAGLGDPYSMYLTKQDLADLNTQLSGTFSGIGVGVEWLFGRPTVTQVYPDTPASRAGLQMGDQIMAIDGVDSLNLTPGETVQRLRGETGTTVRLTILHSDGSTQVIDLARAPIVINPVSYEVLDNDIGYIRLTTFSEGAATQVANALQSFLDGGKVKGVILDLRDNGGGLLTEAYGIASLLVPQGPLVSIVEKGGATTTLESYNPQPLPWSYIVLVNGNSASASEIVAAAVQGRGFGLLVGQHTFGKGSVQTVFTLENGDGLRLTTAHYYGPGGETIDKVGIEPDIYVAPAGTFAGGRVSGRIGWRDIFPGDVGLDVLELQQDLTVAGVYAGALDGVYDRDVQQAAQTVAFRARGIDVARLTPTMQSSLEEKCAQLAESVRAPELTTAIGILKQAINGGN